MIAFETGLYVRVHELPSGPKPFPLESGFSENIAYRVVGAYNASESSDAFFILANDRDELWFICNRHLRAHIVRPDIYEFRFPIEEIRVVPQRYESRPNLLI
jgi:hypothetical protein